MGPRCIENRPCFITKKGTIFSLKILNSLYLQVKLCLKTNMAKYVGSENS